MKQDLIRKEYEDALDKLVEYNTKIYNLYSTAINQEDINNKFSEQCEDVCYELLKFYPEYRKKEYNFNNMWTKEGSYDEYCNAVEILAKLYEKQGRLLEAIKICIRGTKIENNKDNTTYFGRIARLIKKYNKNNKIKLVFDYDNLLLTTEYGELI